MGCHIFICKCKLSSLESIINGVWCVHLLLMLLYKCASEKKVVVAVRRPDKTATDTTTPKGRYTESLTFSTPNCI